MTVLVLATLFTVVKGITTGWLMLGGRKLALKHGAGAGFETGGTGSGTFGCCWIAYQNPGSWVAWVNIGPDNKVSGTLG